MYVFIAQIISMHNHGFDNIVLMCGMYENKSFALRAKLDCGKKDLISGRSLSLSTNTSVVFEKHKNKRNPENKMP